MVCFICRPSLCISVLLLIVLYRQVEVFELTKLDMVDCGIKPDGMYGFIYITTNMVNNKKYIGQRKFYGKWQEYLGSGTLIRRAIEKYGRNAFSRKCISVAETADELNEQEIYWIDNYAANYSDEYYNVSGGGWAGGMRPLSGADNPASRKVECTTTGEIFDSISDAEKHYGVYNVSACCRNKRYFTTNKETGQRLRWRYADDNTCEDAPSMYKRRSKNCVAQYDLNGKFIKCYISAREASETTDTPYSHIIDSCIGKRRSSNGYVWRYCDGVYLEMSDLDFCILNRTENIIIDNKRDVVRGVCFDKSRNKWLSRINVGLKTIQLGRFESIDDAIKERLLAEIKYWPRANWQIDKMKEYNILSEDGVAYVQEDNIKFNNISRAS